MQKKMFLTGMLATVLAFVLGVAGCATYSTVDGVSTPVGMLTSTKINASRPVIAEYTIICGLVTRGYEQFLEATKGKEIDIIDKNYFGFFRKVQAVAR